MTYVDFSFLLFFLTFCFAAPSWTFSLDFPFFILCAGFFLGTGFAEVSPFLDFWVISFWMALTFSNSVKPLVLAAPLSSPTKQ